MTENKTFDMFALLEKDYFSIKNEENNFMMIEQALKDIKIKLIEIKNKEKEHKDVFLKNLEKYSFESKVKSNVLKEIVVHKIDVLVSTNLLSFEHSSIESLISSINFTPSVKTEEPQNLKKTRKSLKNSNGSIEQDVTSKIIDNDEILRPNDFIQVKTVANFSEPSINNIVAQEDVLVNTEESVIENITDNYVVTHETVSENTEEDAVETVVENTTEISEKIVLPAPPSFLRKQLILNRKD